MRRKTRTHLSWVWFSCATLTPVMMNWMPTAGAPGAGAGAVLVAHDGAATCAAQLCLT